MTMRMKMEQIHNEPHVSKISDRRVPAHACRGGGREGMLEGSFFVECLRAFLLLLLLLLLSLSSSLPILSALQLLLSRCNKVFTIGLHYD